MSQRQSLRRRHQDTLFFVLNTKKNVKVDTMTNTVVTGMRCILFLSNFLLLCLPLVLPELSQAIKFYGFQRIQNRGCHKATKKGTSYRKELYYLP